jgi:KUP system potassium uptake protein
VTGDYPAISILSAVEGLRLIPGLENIHRSTLVLIAAIIAIVLFIFQFKERTKLPALSGP